MVWNDSDLNLRLGGILRRYREDHGLSQEAFAAACGISRAYYGRLERGEHSLTLYTCKRIADALALPMYKLFLEL